MVALDPFNRSRVYFHLGYSGGAGIPTGDLARLEEALDTVKDFYLANRITQMLDSLDTIWAKTINGDGAPTYKELISGDINRSVQRSTDPYLARKLAWENYLAETDKLAHQLWVANYWQESTLRYRFERSGGEHINLLPGVADTAIGAARYDIATNGGGFGLSVF